MASSIIFRNYNTGKVIKTVHLNNKAVGMSITYRLNYDTGKLEIHSYFDNKIIQRITVPVCICYYEAR